MNKSLVTNLISIALIIMGYLSPVFSEEIKSMGMYSFSGAITNWLAIHMLFEKNPGLYGSGIITERFEDFKVVIRSLIMNQFFTKENNDDAQMMKSAIHSFKGAVCNFTMGPIIKKLQEIETAAEKGKVSITENELNGLLNEWDEVFDGIESRLNGMT